MAKKLFPLSKGFLICSSLVVGFFLGIWFILTLPDYKIPTKKTSDLQPEVSLSLASSTEVFEKGKEFTLSVVLDSQQKQVWGADLKLSFDPNYLLVKEASAGGYFAKPLVLENLIGQKKGEIAFSIGSLTPGKGKGAIAFLVAEPLKEGKTTLGFMPQTQVALKGKEDPAKISGGDFSLTISR
jgi:hypothetical protein